MLHVTWSQTVLLAAHEYVKIRDVCVNHRLYEAFVLVFVLLILKLSNVSVVSPFSVKTVCDIMINTASSPQTEARNSI